MNDTTPRAECGNCDWTGAEDECNTIHRYSERVDEGGKEPAGECPECGALAYSTERQDMNANPYEARQAARKARYEERAERADQDAKALHEQARDMASVIPFGQPILVGHYSEQSDRRYRDRIHRRFGRSLDAQEKAKHYRGKAAGVGKGGVSSDDPEAVDKLRAKLAKLETAQIYMRGANRAIRAAYKSGIREDGPDEDIDTLRAALKKATGRDHDSARARQLLAPDFAKRRGFADYQLSNNSAEIRRLKKRVESLENQPEPAEDTEGDGWRIVENGEENRLQIIFDAKPPAELRQRLKSHGFRWSPSNVCWQRQLNNSARWAAEQALK